MSKIVEIIIKINDAGAYKITKQKLSEILLKR